jgi:hypothetical protein
MHTTTTAAWVVHNELPRISFGCTNGRSIVRKERYEKNNYFLYLYHHILYKAGYVIMVEQDIYPKKALFSVGTSS